MINLANIGLLLLLN